MRLVRLVTAWVMMLGLGAIGAIVWLIPVRRIRRKCIRALRQMWARALLRLMKVRVRLEPPGVSFSDPVLYVANHTGYVDVLVLMSVMPGVFVANTGIAFWPVIGQIALLGETLFVNRGARLAVGELVAKMRGRLRTGGSVVFFPEATSSGGDSLLPFKSSPFAAAAGEDGAAFPIRPLVLRYEKIGGEPLNTANRDRVFWYNKMKLMPHAWGLLAGLGVDVLVRALPERELTGRRQDFARELRKEMLQEIRIPETVG